MNFTYFFLALCATFVYSSLADSVFDVVDYGAVGDGEADDTQAFRNAWVDTCKSSSTTATMRVPSGKNFLLSPSNFEGPCNPKQVHVRIDGTITAPTSLEKWLCETCARGGQLINFKDMDGLSISGSGTVDGRGENWWNGGRLCHGYKDCKHRPLEFKIEHSNNIDVTDLHFTNSPMKHLVFYKCTKVHVSNVKVTAPGDSENTDGIYISHSSDVTIVDSTIGTGDDCISIGSNTANVYINNTRCGPGHGISIGSLGKHGNHDTVEHIYVHNIELHGTQNGVRIKTWQGGSGYVRDVLFHNIKSFGSRYPIIIDQNYCDHEHCTTQKSAVQISDVRYRNIYGTSAKDTAVFIVCSETVPCTDIFMTGINFSSLVKKHDWRANSVCKNAHGKFHGHVVPAVECLDQD